MALMNVPFYWIENITNITVSFREVVDCRNSGKFLKNFFENQRLFQWFFVKSPKISDKNLNIWNFSDFLQKLKIFVNKNTIKLENIKVHSYQRLFSETFFSDFWKFLKIFENFLNKWKPWLPPWCHCIKCMLGRFQNVE